MRLTGTSREQVRPQLSAMRLTDLLGLGDTPRVVRPRAVYAEPGRGPTGVSVPLGRVKDALEEAEVSVPLGRAREPSEAM